MILQKIAEKTKNRVEHLMLEKSLDELKTGITDTENPFIFEKALKKDDVAFICEVKKASPSKGIISEDFPYMEIAKEYERAWAEAVSVLTEPYFFKGSNQYLKDIKGAVKIPVIRKDFTVSEYQIYEARVIGADAILLICSLLDTSTIKEYIKIADSLGLSCLTEAHTEEEVSSALEAGARIIGVNNRNLSTFEVDIMTSINLRSLVPDDIIFVAESGIKTADDIKMLRENKVNAVLIGETLMRSDNIEKEICKLKGALI